MGLFLDIHTPKYKDQREVIWDMAVAMNKELLALRDAGCKCIQIEEPTPALLGQHLRRATTTNVKFMIEAYNREVQGLDDVEIWIHTCWGNPNMQRVIENDSYRASFELYLEACRGRRVDRRDEGPQPAGDRAVRAVQGRAEEEDLHRRREPPHAAGRTARGRRRDRSARP